MSKDIRSFFLPKKAQKQKTDEDSDVIADSPDVTAKKKKSSRKKRILSDDSDEDFSSKKKKSSKIEKFITSKTDRDKKQSSLKEVNASDIFGSAPIKRTEPLVKKIEKKTEVGIHSDEEFDNSLIELDAIDELIKTKSKSSIECKSIDYKQKKADSASVKHSSISSDITNVKDSNCKHIDKKKANDDKVDMKDINNGHVEKKVDFSEFVQTQDKSVEESAKKKSLNKSLNDTVLSDEERYERKMQSRALYKQYLNRSGPKHLGAKHIPNGAPNCLQNCAFLMTGVLDSFERDEISDAIAKFGGTVKKTISKKVTHLLKGEEAGLAKLAKAEELGIKIITEDEFLKMIEDSSLKSDTINDHKVKKLTKSSSSDKVNLTTPSKKSHKSKANEDAKPSDNNETRKLNGNRKSNDKNSNVKDKLNNPVSRSEEKKKKSKSPSKNETNNKCSEHNEKNEPKISNDHHSIRENGETKRTEHSSNNKTGQDSDDVKSETKLSSKMSLNSLMWVDKYKPQNVKQIIGQHGDASNVKKLMNWLTKWYANRKEKLTKPNPWAKNDDGAYYKAALLSGPPGVGKTTTVSLVCKEMGFDLVEFNASDTRNKTLIKEQLGDLLTTNSLVNYAKGEKGKQAVNKKHVLVMDEVDGMAGNEDRGGLQELINLIKSTSVPIICMCNDRNSQKMRSLVNYCYDLRFSRPRVDQIKSAMMSICYKEGVKIPADALTQLIVASNQDIRQTLNFLSMWAVDSDSNDGDKLKADASSIRKDIKLGPWEAVRKVFSKEEHKSMSIADKSDLFFYDYSLAPLFVQENYLQVAPHCPKNELLTRISNAADSISLGDLVDAKIRSSQAWSLLPLQAMYSSVIPGSEMAGHVAGQIQFPAWLGRNSRAAKLRRLCAELHARTRLRTTGSKSSIYLDYSAHLRDAILSPLLRDKAEGIPESLRVLESYNLTREDLDSLIELSVWPGQRNPMVLIDPKVKAAMTRAYNKATGGSAGAKRRAPPRDIEGEEGVEDEEGGVDTDSDPENDIYIKKKKVETEKPSSSKSKPAASKDKSKTTGKKKK